MLSASQLETSHQTKFSMSYLTQVYPQMCCPLHFSTHKTQWWFMNFLPCWNHHFNQSYALTKFIPWIQPQHSDWWAPSTCYEFQHSPMHRYLWGGIFRQVPFLPWLQSKPCLLYTVSFCGGETKVILFILFCHVEASQLHKKSIFCF